MWFENLDGKGMQWKERTDLTPPGGNRPERYGLAIKVWVCDVDKDGDLDIVEAEADAVDARIMWFENRDKAKTWQCHLISADHTRAGLPFAGRGGFRQRRRPGRLLRRRPPLAGLPSSASSGRTPTARADNGQEHKLLEGKECHEAKAADVDGDGDIDICTKPWNGNLHFYLRNMLVEDSKETGQVVATWLAVARALAAS